MIGVRGGIDDDEVIAVALRALDLLRQRRRMSWSNVGRPITPPVAPLHSRSLRIEVHKDDLLGFCGESGQVDGEGRFSDTPLLRDDGNCLHVCLHSRLPVYWLERWPAKTEQADKWIPCLSAAVRNRA